MSEAGSLLYYATPRRGVRVRDRGYSAAVRAINAELAPNMRRWPWGIARASHRPRGTRSRYAGSKNQP